MLYTYKATIVKIYDGDTVTANVDVGFGINKTIKLRLFGINAPELRGDNKALGRQSRDFLRELILNKEVIIKTKKDKKGKYGRYLGVILIEKDGSQLNINDYLVLNNHAIYKTY
jgi:micrococcal nuclease